MVGNCKAGKDCEVGPFLTVVGVLVAFFILSCCCSCGMMSYGFIDKTAIVEEDPEAQPQDQQLLMYGNNPNLN